MQCPLPTSCGVCIQHLGILVLVAENPYKDESRSYQDYKTTRVDRFRGQLSLLELGSAPVLLYRCMIEAFLTGIGLDRCALHCMRVWLWVNRPLLCRAGIQNCNLTLAQEGTSGFYTDVL
eukprot:4852156-Amphidinium_carterae.1